MLINIGLPPEGGFFVFCSKIKLLNKNLIPVLLFLNTMDLKTFKITTFGCRVNQAESRLIGEKLVNGAMEQCNNEAIVDIVIINTCCVTNKAEREVRKEIRRVKRENPKCFLVVCGCWATKTKNKKPKIKNTHLTGSGQANLKILKLIDLLVENKDKNKVAEILGKKYPNECEWLSEYEHEYENYKDKYAKYKKAMVKIQSGCDNFCAYCIVPYVRGRSKSRSAKQIIKEIKKLVKEGIEEIVLTGIDIASFNFQFSNPNFSRCFNRGCSAFAPAWSLVFRVSA